MGTVWTLFWRARSLRARRQKFLSLVADASPPRSSEAIASRLRTLLNLGLGKSAPSAHGPTAPNEQPVRSLRDEQWQSALDALLYRSVANRAPVSVVQLILEAGADPDARCRESYNPYATALMAAVYTAKEEHVDMLLRAGADPNGVNINGDSSLSLSVRGASLRVFQLLMAAKANPHSAFLGSAELWANVVRSPDRRWLDILLASGVGPPPYDDHGRNLLHAASAYRVASSPLPPGTIRRLVSHGLDVNQASPNGQRPLHVALSNHNMEAAIQLLDNGADPMLPDTSNTLSPWLTSFHLLVTKNLPDTPGVESVIERLPTEGWCWRPANGKTPYEMVVESLQAGGQEDWGHGWLSIMDSITLDQSVDASAPARPVVAGLRL